MLSKFKIQESRRVIRLIAVAVFLFSVMAFRPHMSASIITTFSIGRQIVQGSAFGPTNSLRVAQTGRALR